VSPSTEDQRLGIFIGVGICIVVIVISVLICFVVLRRKYVLH